MALLLELHDFLECLAGELGHDRQIRLAETRRFLPFTRRVLVAVADGGVVSLPLSVWFFQTLTSTPPCLKVATGRLRAVSTSLDSARCAVAWDIVPPFRVVVYRGSIAAIK